MFRRCKDTTISPNIQGYPRFLSVCVSKSKNARGGHCSRGTQKAWPSVCLGSHQKRFSESFPTQRLLCCMEICPPEKLTNVSHFISWGLFCNYQKDVAARRAATSMFWFTENQRLLPLIRGSLISLWKDQSPLTFAPDYRLCSKCPMLNIV